MEFSLSQEKSLKTNVFLVSLIDAEDEERESSSIFESGDEGK